MYCKYLDSCEMMKTLKEFDENIIGYVSPIVERWLCQTGKYEDCYVYKLKEALAEKKSKNYSTKKK